MNSLCYTQNKPCYLFILICSLHYSSRFCILLIIYKLTCNWPCSDAYTNGSH